MRTDSYIRIAAQKITEILDLEGSCYKKQVDELLEIGLWISYGLDVFWYLF